MPMLETRMDGESPSDFWLLAGTTLTSAVEDSQSENPDTEEKSDTEAENTGTEDESTTVTATQESTDDTSAGQSAQSLWPAAGFLLGTVFLILALCLLIKGRRKSRAKEKKKSSSKKGKRTSAKRTSAQNSGSDISRTLAFGENGGGEIPQTLTCTGVPGTEIPRTLAGSGAGMSEALLTPEFGKLHEQGARPDQQDCFSVSDLQGYGQYGVLAVVADGMGGLSDGGRVSQCAVSSMMEGFYRLDGDPQAVLLTLVEQTAAAVNTLLGPNGLNRSGSTLVAAIAKENRFSYVSIGDSRICLYRGGNLIQLNREHVLRRDLEIQAINREISWAEAAAHPKAQGLTSFLGMGALRYVDIPGHTTALQSGDRLILMSDGVYNALTEAELCAALEKDAQEAADDIRAQVSAKNYEQQDNYTAIILAF